MVDDGTATVSATGGSGTLTYNWTPAPGAGQGTTNATGLVGGQAYTVTVTDGGGCTDVVVVNIGTDPDPIATITIDANATCSGVCDGEATVNITNGTPTYTFVWSNGETTQQAQALCVGGISVDITDANGCTATATATITEPSALTLSISGTDPLCNGSLDGSADATIGGGTPGYTTSWAHGPTSEDLTGVLGSGTYTLEVTDANGCTISEDVTIIDPSPITSSITGTDISCNGSSDGTATATGSGGTGTLTYSWSPVPGGGQGTAGASGLDAVTYTCLLYTSDAADE